MKAIQSTAVIEIGYERLSRRNGRRTNRSAYITRRVMNIPMIRMIYGDEEGIRVLELHTYASWGVCRVLTTPFVRYAWIWQDSATKTIMGTTSGMGRVRDRLAEHPAAPPSSLQLHTIHTIILLHPELQCTPRLMQRRDWWLVTRELDGWVPAAVRGYRRIVNTAGMKVCKYGGSRVEWQCVRIGMYREIKGRGT